MRDSNYQRLIDDYLDRVSAELADLPADERTEILEDLRVHIMDAIGEPERNSEADIRNVLNRLGSPQAVAREARDRSPEPAPSPAQRPPSHDRDKLPGTLEVAAIILTALFWPVGVLLAWISERWKTRDKLIATIVPFLSTLMFAVVVIGGFAFFSGEATIVTQEADQAAPSGQDAGSEAPPEPRSPTAISESSDEGGVLSRMIVVIGFLGGIVAGPFVSAVFLAVRMQPLPRSESERQHRSRHGVPARGHV